MYQKFSVHGRLAQQNFLQRMTTSRVKIRLILKKVHDIYFMKQRSGQACNAKIIRAVNYRFIVDIWKGSEFASNFEYKSSRKAG